jgi:hypothetical protein
MPQAPHARARTLVDADRDENTRAPRAFAQALEFRAREDERFRGEAAEKIVVA